MYKSFVFIVAAQLVAQADTVDHTHRPATPSLKEIVKASCGSQLLNELLTKHPKIEKTVEYSSPEKSFVRVSMPYASVVWGGDLTTQSFARSKNLPAAFINDTEKTELTRAFAKISRQKIEQAEHIGKDQIRGDTDQAEVDGAVAFLEFVDDRLSSISIDCGQIEPDE